MVTKLINALEFVISRLYIRTNGLNEERVCVIEETKSIVKSKVDNVVDEKERCLW